MVFSNEPAVALLKKNFVSVWVSTRGEYRREEDVKALEDMLKQIPTYDPSTRAAIFLNPSGEVIKGVNFTQKSHLEIFIKEAQALADKYPPKMEDRSVPAAAVQPVPGTMRLKVYVRNLEPKQPEPPSEDVITLTEAEWKTLVPKKLEAGAAWDLPESVVSKLAGYFYPGGQNTAMDMKVKGTLTATPGAVRDARLPADDANGQGATVQLHGSVRLSYRSAGWSLTPGKFAYEAELKLTGSYFVTPAGAVHKFKLVSTEAWNRVADEKAPDVEPARISVAAVQD